MHPLAAKLFHENFGVLLVKRKTWYRKQAGECLKLAKRSANQFDHKSWPRLADDWIKLAEADEERRAKFWPPRD
jgi:hypothetical protein